VVSAPALAYPLLRAVFELRPPRSWADGRPRPASANLDRVTVSGDILSRCQAGEPAAFRELFETHRVEVTRLVFRMTRGSAELEDLVQEVFVQVHKSLPSFRSEARLSTWIFRIAVNVVLMQRRASRTRPLMLVSRGEPAQVDESGLPDEQLARRRRIEALYRIVDRMTEKKRTVYLLHELEGLAPQEIAKVLGVPVLTIRTRLFYARREVLSLLSSEPALSGIAQGMGSPSSDRPRASAEPHKEPA